FLSVLNHDIDYNNDHDHDNDHKNDYKNNYKNDHKNNLSNDPSNNLDNDLNNDDDNIIIYCGSGALPKHMAILKSAHWSQYITTMAYCKKKRKCKMNIAPLKKYLKKQFSIIEDSELVEIVQYLNPKAELVKADTIKNILKSLYNFGKRKLKA
ncbi:29427_t:CDS:2, partial [Gigaspora margarita]